MRCRDQTPTVVKHVHRHLIGLILKVMAHGLEFTEWTICNFMTAKRSHSCHYKCHNIQAKKKIVHVNSL